MYDSTPCGFSTLMYYRNDKVAIIDHMAIDTKVRGIGAFFAFVDQISDFLTTNNIFPDYVVAEIMKRSQSIEGQINPLHLIRLLRTIGFHVVQIPYISPHTGILDDMEKYRSTLMVIPRHPLTDLPAEECKRLISLIYDVHYLKWYRRAIGTDKMEPYEAALKNCFAYVAANLKKNTLIRLNGSSELSEDGIYRSGFTKHALDFTRTIWVVSPIAVGISISFTQSMWVTAVTISISVLLVLGVFIFQPWRERLMRFFWR